MKYFANNRDVNFKMLQESGIYPQRLLQELRSGNYYNLRETLDLSLRENENFMEPLLYAVKNERGTFEIFKYYGENLQQSDLGLTIEVVVEEPHLIEDTAVSKNKQFIKELAEVNPEVIEYMSDDLKSDPEFIKELVELNDKEITAYVARECEIEQVIKDNPELANNSDFMMEAIKKDASAIEFASEELKNDYDFIKQSCKDNREVITHIAEHTQNFGKEALTATKEVLKDDTTCRAVEDMKQELEKVKEQKALMEAKEGFDENSDEYKNLARREKACERHLVLFDKIRSGEYNPERAARLGLKLLENVPEEYKKDMMQYLKLDEALLEKKKEDKDVKVNPQDIEKVSSDAKLSEIQEETQAIRDEITLEKDKEQEQEKVEIGEE